MQAHSCRKVAAVVLPHFPIGIAVDFISGAAWDDDPPKPFSFYGVQKPKPLFPGTIAIAPPQYSDEFVSDELAGELQLLLKKRYPQSKVFPYENKIEIFNAYEMDHDDYVREDFCDSMYWELGSFLDYCQTRLEFKRIPEV